MNKQNKNNELKKIILLSGWKGSGKDTAASILTEHFDFKRIAFADNLKDSVSKQFGIPRNYFDDRILKESPILSLPVKPTDKNGIDIVKLFLDELKSKDGKKSGENLFWTPRALCILEGSVKRAINPDYWVISAISELSPDKNYVFSDVRFTSEVNYIKNNIKSHKVIVVRIVRLKSVNTRDPSERDLDNYSFDFVIENKETIFDLKSSVEKLLSV